MGLTKVQYRQYTVDPEFPVFSITGENRPINQIYTLNDGDEIRYMHLHNCIEIAYVTADDGELCIDEKTQTLKKDDLVVLMPYSTHILREKHSGPYAEYLYFDPAVFIRKFCPDALPLCEAFESKNSPTCTVLRGENAQKLRGRVREILDELQGKEAYDRFCVKGLLLALIVELSRTLPCEKPLERRSSAITPIVPAIQYINEHFSENISMEELQEECHLSATHFRRVFGAVMGCTPLEYIQNLRVNRACDMLLSSDISILDASLAVGFDSISSFNRHFAKILGVPPSVWRRERRHGLDDYMPKVSMMVETAQKTTEN